MAKFEVVVRTVVDCYYLVDAKDEFEARTKWALGDENGEVVVDEGVIDSFLYDDRFDEDNDAVK